MNNRPARNNPDEIIDRLLKNATIDELMKKDGECEIDVLYEQIDKYEKALFVIGEIAISFSAYNFEDTIVGIVDSLNIPKLTEKEFNEYLKKYKEQKQ